VSNNDEAERQKISSLRVCVDVVSVGKCDNVDSQRAISGRRGGAAARGRETKASGRSALQAGRVQLLPPPGPGRLEGAGSGAAG